MIVRDEGSSKPMEADEALTMLKRRNKEYSAYFKNIVSYDDSAIKILLKHEKVGGDLPSSIIQPIFWLTLAIGLSA